MDMEAVLQRLTVAEPRMAPALGPEAEAQFALLRRCQAGEPGAFEELLRRHLPRVQSVIYGILRNSNDAEDIAQQVFTKVYFSMAKFDFRSAVSTWVYKITVNECYDYLRKQKVRKAVLLADLTEEESARVENLNPAVLSGAASMEDRAAYKDLTEKLLRRLTPEERILLILKEVEGYSIQEIAGILGMNENTAKVRLFRARQKLLSRMKRSRI